MKYKGRRNLNERQDQALVNLRQLSQSPWNLMEQQLHVNQNPVQQKTYTNTIQSIQLPLNPKNAMITSKQESIQTNRQRLSPLSKPRPHTIHNNSIQQSSQPGRYSKVKFQPLTSLNFYDLQGKSYNTFDDRTRLNEQIQVFASRIKHEQQLLKSIDFQRSKNKSTVETNTNNFKANVAKRSFFYKQFKNFLVQSFKVDGKPVNIQKDRYSIQPHGLPKKRSIYSFKNRNPGGSSLDKTDIILKNVGRYDIDNKYGMDAKYDMDFDKQIRTRRKSRSHKQSVQSSYLSQTINLRQNEHVQKRIVRGRLWRGRPPSKVVASED